MQRPEGDHRKVVFFASRLQHSPYALVTLVAHQLKESLVRALAERFGGLPLIAMFDRPKTVARRSDLQSGAALDWNQTFKGVTIALDGAVELWCRTR